MPMLEWFDTRILPKYVGHVPVIGICRGLQTLNVLYGGTLTQHFFFNGYSKHGNDLVDTITDWPIGEVFKVNSFHHQGIKRIGTGFTPVATNEHGLVESIRDIGNNVFAVQWHPERMYNDESVFYDTWTIQTIFTMLGMETPQQYIMED